MYAPFTFNYNPTKVDKVKKYIQFNLSGQFSLNFFFIRRDHFIKKTVILCVNKITFVGSVYQY